ncbi:MAG TPA: hypothetical protein VFU13_15175 [Steroidobacteraceae bacterium]|nr:hypothetical protein [Steroidobacteraceae bacterium]
MIEAYSFLAVFAVQLLAMSVLHPLWLGRHVRLKAAEFPADRFRQLYPDIDPQAIVQRSLKWYRVLNTVVALLGLLLWGWLFSYMQRADWDDGPVEALVGVYFMVQMLPICIAAVFALKYNQLLKQLLETKRTAVLQRRGLFDFVSPFAVLIAVLCYFLFVAYVLYIAQNPFPGFAGPLINIGVLTFVYALQAFGVYRTLYRKKTPFETHAARMHTIGMGVKACVYICIAFVVHISINFTLVLLDLQRWEPFAVSVFFVFVALLIFMVTAPPRRPDANGLGASAAS